MNDEHVLAFIETVDGTNLDAVRELALDAIVHHHIGHRVSLIIVAGFGVKPPLR
jgi:hypothetical protein